METKVESKKRKIYVNGLEDLWDLKKKHNKEIVETHFSYQLETDDFIFVYKKFD